MPEKPGSPHWWVERLTPKLTEQDRTATAWGNWYDGEHPQMFSQERWRTAFGGLFRDFAVNYSALVVDSVAERLRVVGFRIGDQPQSDADAWRIWQRCGMDAESDSAHVDALACGLTHLLVWGDSDDQPVISVENASEVVVASDPGNRRRRLAAMKRYTDEYGDDQITLWLPDGVHKLRHRPRAGRLAEVETSPNPLGVVPVVPLAPQRRRNVPTSEIKRIAPLQAAMNKILADSLVASEYGAFPQRYAVGLTDLDDEDEQKLIEEARKRYALGLDTMIVDENADAKFGAFPATDLRNYVAEFEMLSKAVFTISRLPFHYSAINMANPPSGESITSAEAGIVAVSTARARQLGESHEEAVRLAFRVMGDPRADATSAETVWDPHGHRSEAVTTDAAVKKQTMGVPQRQLHEDMGYSPQQIARFPAMRAEEALGAAVRQTLAPAFQEPARVLPPSPEPVEAP